MSRLLSVIFAVCTAIAIVSPAMADRDDRDRDRGGDRESYWGRYRPNEEIYGPRGIDVPPSSYLLDKKQADVTGGGTPDSIYLIGIKSSRDDRFCRETFLLIEDGRTGRFYKIDYKLGGSVGGKLWYGRIDDDSTPDIMVTLPTGGSGGLNNYVLLSFRGRRTRFLVDPKKWSDGLRFNVYFRDDFKVKVDTRDYRKNFYIDVRGSKSEYIQRGVYNRYGELKRREAGAADGFSLVEPKQRRDGTWALIAYQAIWGLYHADSLANARSTWEWQRDKLTMVDLDLIPRR